MPDPSLEKPKLNLKKMGFKKSVIHLWTYYKWWVIIPVIVIAIIISFVNSYLKAAKKEYLSIACVNARYESNHIFDEYAKSIGQTISVDCTYHFPTNEDSSYLSQDMTNSVQKLVSLMQSEVIDIVVTNSRAIKEYGEAGVRDLSEVLSKEQLEDLENRGILFYLELEGGKRFPAGINVTDMDFFYPAYNGSEEKHYLMLSKFSSKTEEERLLIEYLFFS